MGNSRAVKRVALDFKWPIGMLWKGYFNPYTPQDCAPCRGWGWSFIGNQNRDKHGHTYRPVAGDQCEWCNGTGKHWYLPQIERLHNNFQCYEPPEGPGWQLWMETDGGSPMTPVFAYADELAEHCVIAEVRVFAHFTATKETWLDLCRGSATSGGLVYTSAGWVPDITKKEIDTK
jgi:hypothetical protein